MKKSILFAALVASGAAHAADAALGASLYQDQCASCHTASRTTVDRPGKNPDLLNLMKNKEAADLNKWILQPAKRAKDTACDTSVVARTPDQLPNLWAFLQGRLDAPPATRVERRKSDLSKADLAKWKNRNRGEQ